MLPLRGWFDFHLLVRYGNGDRYAIALISRQALGQCVVVQEGLAHSLASWKAQAQ